jgi:hypothetical protein
LPLWSPKWLVPDMLVPDKLGVPLPYLILTGDIPAGTLVGEYASGG